MIDFIMTNLQGFLLGGAVIVSAVYALTGFERVEAEDGENDIRYQPGRWKRNLALAGILIGLTATVAFVPRGYVGVVYDWDGGIQQDERPEGLNFVFPFKQHVTNVDVRVKAWVFNNPEVYVHTFDFHEIRVPFAINYRIKPSEAAFVLQNVAGEPAETILSHAALNSLRTEVGKVKLDVLAQNVAKIAEDVANTILPQAERNGLELQYVAIEDSVIDKPYVQAVQAERISEREIRTAKNNADAALEKAKEKVNLAEGEAAAIERLAQAREAEQARLGLTPTEYVWYSKWDGVLPQTLLGGNADFIVNLPN